MPILIVPLTTAGALLDVGVSVSTSYTRYGNPPETFKALIDTGAGATAISPDVVAALAPQQIGTLPITRPGGATVWAPTYDVRIRFDGVAGAGRWYDVEACMAIPATPDVDLLIGVDLLLRIRMTWDGRGRLLSLYH